MEMLQSHDLGEVFTETMPLMVLRIVGSARSSRFRK